MPGQFNNNDNEDGGSAITQSSAKNGLVGTNGSTDAIPQGVPGGNGVFGFTRNSNAAGVFGINEGTGRGLAGFSDKGDGTEGSTKSSERNGIVGFNHSVEPVPANTAGGNGVFGFTKNPTAAGVYGHNDGKGPGIRGFSRNGPAGHFLGDVEVTGDIRLVNADCAEDFDVSANGDGHNIEPGTVMVLNDGGNLEPSCQAYDKKVAGVISGAGGYKPGIVLDKQEQQESEDKAATRRLPVALMGKVYCKVDASLSPIEVGDLLTTSTTEGHAMKASDPIKAFGTVIGKALRPLREGRGMIPVLVALQ
jgi:hypothetical protein